MEVRLLIESCPAKGAVAKVKKFKKLLSEASIDTIHALVKKVHKIFPDSTYTGMSITIAVPTAQNLVIPGPDSAAARTLRAAWKELGY